MQTASWKKENGQRSLRGNSLPLYTCNNNNVSWTQERCLHNKNEEVRLEAPVDEATQEAEKNRAVDQSWKPKGGVGEVSKSTKSWTAHTHHSRSATRTVTWNLFHGHNSNNVSQTQEFTNTRIIYALYQAYISNIGVALIVRLWVRILSSSRNGGYVEVQ